MEVQGGYRSQPETPGHMTKLFPIRKLIPTLELLQKSNYLLSYSHSLITTLSTYSIASSLILFVLSSCFNTPETPFPFVIALAGLVSPVIHFTSAISLRLYNYRKYSTLIIRRFSYIVLSLIRQLYSDFELVQVISGKLILSILLIVALIVPAISKPYTIVYSSKASTLLVTLLYLIEVQYSIFI